MRRSFLKSLVGATAAVTTGRALADVTPNRTDVRLLGEWVCNKERTLALWRYHGNETSKERQEHSTMFDNRKIVFTGTEVRRELGSAIKRIYPYTVLSQDHRSVVIEEQRKNEQLLWHIVFEPNDVLYYADGYNLLFYKKTTA